MAMTLNIESDFYSNSIYDSIWARAISSASGQTDLKYIVEIYNAGNKLFEGKIVPEPSNKYMYFDIAPIARNEFSEEFFLFDFSDKFDAKTSGYSGLLDIRIGSDYSGISTLNEASGQANINFTRPKLKNRRWLRTPAYNSGNAADMAPKWITDRKLVSTLYDNGDRFFIGFDVLDFNDDVSGGVSLKWESYNSANTLLNSSSYVEISPGNILPRWILNIGPDGLDTITGSSPDLNSCAYYTVKIRWESLETSQMEYLPEFRINKGCSSKYTSVPIHFYNRFNSVDTMRFDLVSRTTMDVERKSYNQRDYRFSGSSVLYTDSSASGTTVFRENKINYNATYNYTMKLTSDFLDDQDWEWLEDLILSPKVYMEEDGYFYPVTIKATNYEISKYINNRLRPLEIEIEFNSPRLSSSR